MTLAEGRTLEVELAPKGGAAAPGEKPPGPDTGTTSWWSAHHVAGVGLCGLGVAGLAVGAGMGGAAAGKKTDLEKVCGPDLKCPPASHSDADDYNGMRTFPGAGDSSWAKERCVKPPAVRTRRAGHHPSAAAPARRGA